MNEFSTYEFAVSQKIEGKWRLARILLISFYILYPVLLLFFAMGTSVIAPLLALIPISLWIIIFITWRFVSVEYEYSITSGVLTFAKIFGNNARKNIMEVHIKDATVIAPLTDKLQYSKLEAYAPEKIYSALSSPDAEDGYFMLYEQDGVACAFLFEATAQTLKICRFYNPSATVVSKVRY